MPASDAPRPFRRRVLLNTAAIGAANGWAMVVALVSLPLLLKGLGTVAFGVWALLQTFSAVTGWFSLLDLGISTAATREVAARHGVEDHAGLGTAVGSTLAVMAGLGVASAALVAVVGPLAFPHLFRAPASLVGDLRLAAVFFAIQIGLDLLSGGLQSVLDGYQRIDLSRLIDVVRRTLVAVFASVAALVWHRLDLVALASMAATAIGTVAALVVVGRLTHGLRRRPNRATIVALVRYGRTVAVLRPLGVLHRTIDRFVVGAILGPGAVSVVEIATQLQNGSDAVLSAASYAVVPSAARLEAQGERRKLVELLQTGTRYVLLVTWPVAALTAVLAGPAIHLWVGPSYRSAAGLTAVAIVSLVLIAPAQVASNLLLGTGRAAAILRVAALAIAVNAVGSVVLVHFVGIVGAFQATVASSIVTTPLLLRVALRDLDVPAGRFVRTAVGPALPALAGAVVGAGAVVLLDLAPVAELLVGGGVGTVLATAAAVRWGLHDGERARVLGRFRRAAPTPAP